MIKKAGGEKKLDVLNLFYSIGAVVILLGVIAKLLEWEVQDIFMTVGLTMEAVVFGVSSIRFVNKDQTADSEEIKLDNQFHQEEASVTPFESEKVNDQLIHSYVLPQTNHPSNTATFTQNPTDLQSTSFPQNSTHQGLSNFSTNNQSSNHLSNGIPVVPIEQLAPDILWQLDKLGIISFPKEIFYQPEWSGFSELDYALVTQLFLDLFGKKVVPQKNLPLLKSYGIRLPESGIGDLTIDQPMVITNDDLKTLILAFKPYRYKGFFDQFILYTEGEQHYIRSIKIGEIQIYAGVSLVTKQYCDEFHPGELITSPALDFLAPFIKMKNEILLDYLIKRIPIQNPHAVDLMCKMLFDKADPTKIYFLEKLKAIDHSQQSQDSFSLTKSIVLLLASFSNQKVAKDLLGKLLIINRQGAKAFKFEDIIRMPLKGIQVSSGKFFIMEDLFDESYISNNKVMLDLEEKLIQENIIDINLIVALFTTDKVDNLKDIYKKFNQYVNQYGIYLNSKQLEFALLCKTEITKL